MALGFELFTERADKFVGTVVGTFWVGRGFGF
jgi:hypothetical protein